MLAIIILGALMGLALPRVGKVKGLLYATGLCTVYIIIAYWMFVHTRVWLNIVYPLLVLSMTYLGHTFNSMVQQLQGAFRDLQASEQKYRGLFADIDLLRPLAFQVEQVFLIHHETGLLLLHVAADPASAHDPDLISSMLIAIQDFMQDSFRVATDAGPETFQIGGLTVWVEQDALAVLAAVIHGIPPRTVRTLLQETLATIHEEHAEALGAFTGDATPFATSRPLLEACLVAETAPPPSPALSRLWPLLVCLISAHRWGIMSRIQANRRWASYVQTLRTEPGIVVTAAAKRRGTYYIAGLHDPLATDPDVLLATYDIDPARVTSHWQPYHALLPAFMLARVHQVLDPPETVALELDNGVLSATGTAPHAWIVTARQQARLIPGIAQFQEDRLLDADMQQLEALRTLLAPPETVSLRLADGAVYATGTTPHAWLVESRQRLHTLSSPVPYRDDQLIDSDVQRFTVLKECIESTVLLFCHGTVACVPGQEEKLARLVSDMQELYEVADVLGKHLRVTLLGHTDPYGTEAVYGPLDQQRAEQLHAILVKHGMAARALSAVGVGMKAPLRLETTAEAPAFNCSVSFQIVVSNELQ